MQKQQQQQHQQSFNINLQLPSIFQDQQEVTLQLLGYKLDPNHQLNLNKEQNCIYERGDLGHIRTIILQEHKKCIQLYEAKYWKNAIRALQPFTFEVELIVRVIDHKSPSIRSQLIQSRPKNQHYQIISLPIDSLPDEKQLTNMINSVSDEMIKKISSKNLKRTKVNTSLAPKKIFNPHIFIKTIQKQKHVEYYTKGIYEYYHYGDQSFNDHGWGCAYRSLQTILSWLNLQSHIKLPTMPTLTQIQQIIDNINLSSSDRLKGTREWIGATEVSWVVKKMSGYDCRILHISDGKDIIEHCQMFREHFEKVGCPIMYGGGQYAYSIVGVNYSWQLGECQFLILDPHYPGADSLDKILQKKGLAWRKPEDMFKKGIFYNFCLPLIPHQQ